MVYGFECVTKSVQILGGTLLKFCSPKTSICILQFVNFANNSRVEQDTVSVSHISVLKPADTLLCGSVILYTLVH